MMIHMRRRLGFIIRRRQIGMALGARNSNSRILGPTHTRDRVSEKDKGVSQMHETRENECFLLFNKNDDMSRYKLIDVALKR